MTIFIHPVKYAPITIPTNIDPANQRVLEESSLHVWPLYKHVQFSESGARIPTGHRNEVMKQMISAIYYLHTNHICHRATT